MPLKPAHRFSLHSLVFHLFVQLEALPSWAYMAPQRIGEMTAAGPLTEECQLSEKELDWCATSPLISFELLLTRCVAYRFTSGLELACFFTPLASMRLHELTEGRKAREEPEMSMLDYSYAPTDSHSATPASNASLPTIHSPPQQQQVYSSLPADTPPTLLSAPLPAPSIFPPPPPPAQATLSPYTFDAYGNPSLDLGRGSPAPHSHSHPHPHANGHSHSSSHVGGHSSSGVSQEAWLQGLDFDAMIGGAGGRPAPTHNGYAQQSHQQQYQQQPRYGQQQQQQQWMGGTGAADLSEPFDEGGRWGVSMNQW